MNWLKRWLLVASLLLVCVSVAQAQDIGELLPLNLMETVGGLLDDATPEMQWQFAAQRGDSLSLVVQTIQGDLDPVLQVFDSAGRLVAEHDDIAYPDDVNAALELVEIPRDDTYTVVVGRFDGAAGSTTGEFVLSLVPGYAGPVAWDSFDGQQVWATGDPSLAEAVQADGQLALAVQTANTLAWAAPEDAASVPETAYVQVDFAVENAPDYWESGVILRQSSPTDYYLFAVSSRGDWAFLARAGASTWLHLQDWTEHPAVADLTEGATLGVLMAGEDFIFYVDGIALGAVMATTHAGPGTLALSAGTIDQQETLPIIQFDNLLVTEPLVMAPLAVEAEVGLPLVNWESRDPAAVVFELVAQDLVREGGEQGMFVPSSFTTISSPGMQALPLGQGRIMTDFVMATTITLESANAANACGLVFREQDEARYSIGFLDGLGGLGVAEWHDDRFDPAFYRLDDLPFAELDQVHLIIAAQDDVVRVYINGEPVTVRANPAIPGGVGIAALSYDGAYVECRFGDTWLWTWEE
ncbi:hypothetical protein ACFLYO_03935 [Chloroflexota bacterium]